MKTTMIKTTASFAPIHQILFSICPLHFSFLGFSIPKTSRSQTSPTQLSFKLDLSLRRAHRIRFRHMKTTCGVLLSELQTIWDEIGESDSEKDKMLVDLERECLEVYRKKVDKAKKGRAQIRQAIADAEAELVDICSAMSEMPIHVRQNGGGSLKEELKTVIPLLEEMRVKRIDRRKQFLEIIDQLQTLSGEIYGSTDERKIFLDENDLSVMKLEDLRRQLHELQNEKTNRLNLVTGYLHTLNLLCTVLGIDYKEKINEMNIVTHGSEGVKGIHSDTTDKLCDTIQSLQALRTQRMQRLQEIATAIIELWNLMDTPVEEQQKVQNITSNIAVSEEELTEPNILSADFISYAEAELSKLEYLKQNKMKDLVLKKKLELDDLCRKTHIILDEHAVGCAMAVLDAGLVDAMFMLGSIELQITKVKEEASSRKEILEKVEKWFAAREEEAWLEEYNRDDNRYSAGRGAHLALKRAEKARIIVNKIPAMVEALTVKTKVWEKERGSEFLYDGVSLLSMLEQYNILRQEKEQAKQRLRDQKKLLGQLMTEQEALYGSKPSPSKSGKKLPRMSSVGAASARRATMAVSTIHTCKPETAASQTRINKKVNAMGRYNLNHQQYGCVLTGERNPGKNSSSNEAAFVRKPFSPVSPNINLVQDDQNKICDYTPPRALASNKTPPPKSQTPPPKKQDFSDDENKTPNIMHHPQQPATPSTASTALMYTAMTSTTPRVVRQINMAGDEAEYSFEELRAAGFCP